MRNPSIYLIVALAIGSASAQQTPLPIQPVPAAPAQVKPVPCTPSSVVPKRVHVKIPAWLQKQIDKQQAKMGTTIDTNGAIQDAMAPKPCPPVTPSTPTPAAPSTNSSQPSKQ